MRYKKLFLLVFILILFVAQQVSADAKADATFSIAPPLARNFQPMANISSTVHVVFFRLNPDGSLKLDANDIPATCTLKVSDTIYDNSYGCTQYPNGGYAYAYPYPNNPYDVPMETDYLLDVLAHEMDPHLFYDPNSAEPNKTLPAARAQSVAARTLAYYKESWPLTNFGDGGTRSDGLPYTGWPAAQLDIPFAFEAWIQSPPLSMNTPVVPNNPSSPCASTNLEYLETYVCDAVTSTQGIIVSINGSVIDAEFGNDMEHHTANGNTYLVSVQEPISTICDVGIVGNGLGMSQNGANRWVKGDQCATVGSGSQPWPVKWSDYRQILVHYYTGIDILGSGGKIAPDDRWNLLNRSVIPAEIPSGQEYPITLTIQNTSTSDWNEDVSLRWTLAESCRSADSTPDAAWNEITLDVNHGHKGEDQDVTITIPTDKPGSYTLYVDMKRNSTNTWFRNGVPGGWPYVQIPVQIGNIPSLTNIQKPISLYPYGLTGCYYNDTPTSTPLDTPINWKPFSTYVTTIPNKEIGFRYFPYTPASGVNSTYWSARWVGKLYVTQADDFTFYMHNLDDGGRLYIDNIEEDAAPVIDSWLVQGPHTYPSQPIHLAEGLHDIRVDYVQGPPNVSSLILQWSTSSSPTPTMIFRSEYPPSTVVIYGKTGAPGATLYYTDGIAKSVTADASGNYSLVVPYGWSGTVTPSLAGYTFNPANISYPATYIDRPLPTTSDFAPTSVLPLTVTNTSDSGSGSLRDAIAYANPGATILFASNLSGQTINLNNTLFITKNITIDSSMLTSPVILSGAGVTPHVTVLTVNTGVTVTLKNLTITNGTPGINNSGALTIRNSNIGNNSSSGIVNNGGGDLTITDTIISNNTGDANGGGGIRNSNNGKVTIISSTVSNNTATVATYSSGGGVFNLGKLIVMSSTFSNNTTSASGGGINNNAGELEVISSTFYGNVATGNTAANIAGVGGGIYNSISYPKYITVTNSTFFNNSAKYGGGIYHTGSYNSNGYLVVTNSTFSENVATSQGGGIYNASLLYYTNSILANSTGGDCVNDVYDGHIAVSVNNLVEDGSCSAGSVNLQTGDPQLGVLGSNGGPTQTMALLPGSPAINAGDSMLCEDTPVNNRDQRGVLRTHDTQCDLGAYEYYIDPAIPTVGTFTAPATLTSLNIPITSFTASDDVGVTGYMITESAIAPSYGGNGWSSTPPMAYTVSTAGTHILYPWVKDTDGNVSVVYNSPASVNVVLDTTPPTTTSITRASTNPTNAASVNYTVTFSEPVTGVAANDFSLTTSGLPGASITGVSGSGNSYTVTVNTGSGTGTLQLVIPTGATITDLVGNALSNLPFVGEVYTIDKTAPTVVSSNRASTNPTNSASVDYTVTFSEAVTGVATNDFSLTTSGLSGTSVTNISGSGNSYTVTVNTGSGSGTLKLIIPATATIYDSVGNALGSLPFTTGQVYNVRTNTFSDVLVSYWAWEYIERVYSAGVAGGCSTNPLMYCPETNVTRDVMAVFLLRAKYGSSYTPPPVGSSTGFNDVPTTYWAAAWIKELAAEGITNGCGNGNYCPGTVVTREQMTIFLLRTKHGATYTPPTATGTMFTDVPQNYWAAAWIEQLVHEGISGGCTATTFCPSTSVTRAQMAVFLVRAFNLP